VEAIEAVSNFPPYWKSTRSQVSLCCTLKSLGLLRRSRGRRGGPSNKDCNRIRPIISVNRSNASYFKKKSKTADAEPLNILPQRSSHYGANLSNLIIVKRQQMQPPPIRFKPLDFTLLNVRSVKNKPHIIKDFVVDNDIDLLALTETWLRSGNTDQMIISELCPTGYSFVHLPRPSRGGGVGLLYNNRFKSTKQSSDISFKFSSFEFVCLRLDYSSLHFLLLIVYRAPPSGKKRQTTSVFLDEFARLLETLSTGTTPLLIVGDFNFHLDVQAEPAALQFRNLLESFNLKQHVKGPVPAIFYPFLTITVDTLSQE
jgi:hypothetical protein